MPIDATTAALIGAAVGAAGSAVGAAITATVTRTNSYRQHLYEKRLDTYERAWVAVGKWYSKDYVNLDLHEIVALTARINLHASLPVMGDFTKLRAHVFAIVKKRAEQASTESEERAFAREVDNFQTELAQESRGLPTLGLATVWRPTSRLSHRRRVSEP